MVWFLQLDEKMFGNRTGYFRNNMYYRNDEIRECINNQGLYHRIGDIDMYKVNQNYLFMSQDTNFNSEMLRNNENVEDFLMNNDITSLIEHFIGNILSEVNKRNVSRDNESLRRNVSNFIFRNTIINTPVHDDPAYSLFRRCMILSEYCLLKCLKCTGLFKWENILDNRDMDLIYDYLLDKLDVYGSVYKWLDMINSYLSNEENIPASYFENVLSETYEYVNNIGISIEDDFNCKRNTSSKYYCSHEHSIKKKNVKLLKENWKQKKSSVYITFHIPQRAKEAEKEEPVPFSRTESSSATSSATDDPIPNKPVIDDKKDEKESENNDIIHNEPVIDNKKDQKNDNINQIPQSVNQNVEIKINVNDDKVKISKKRDSEDTSEEDIIIDRRTKDDKKGKVNQNTSCVCANKLSEVLKHLESKPIVLSDEDKKHIKVLENLKFSPKNDNSTSNEIKTGDVNIYLTNTSKDDGEDAKEKNVFKINTDDQSNIIISKKGDGKFDISTHNYKQEIQEKASNAKITTSEDESNKKRDYTGKPEIVIHNNIFSTRKDDGNSKKIDVTQAEIIKEKKKSEAKIEDKNPESPHCSYSDNTGNTKIINNVNISEAGGQKGMQEVQNSNLPVNSIFNVTINNQTSHDKNNKTEEKKEYRPVIDNQDDKKVLIINNQTSDDKNNKTGEKQDQGTVVQNPDDKKIEINIRDDSNKVTTIDKSIPVNIPIVINKEDRVVSDESTNQIRKITVLVSDEPAQSNVGKNEEDQGKLKGDQDKPKEERNIPEKSLDKLKEVVDKSNEVLEKSKSGFEKLNEGLAKSHAILENSKNVLDESTKVLDKSKEVHEESNKVLDKSNLVLDKSKDVLEKSNFVCDESTKVLDKSKEILDMSERGHEKTNSVLDKLSSVLDKSNSVLDNSNSVLDKSNKGLARSNDNEESKSHITNNNAHLEVNIKGIDLSGNKNTISENNSSKNKVKDDNLPEETIIIDDDKKKDKESSKDDEKKKDGENAKDEENLKDDEKKKDQENLKDEAMENDKKKDQENLKEEKNEPSISKIINKGVDGNNNHINIDNRKNIINNISGSGDNKISDLILDNSSSNQTNDKIEEPIPSSDEGKNANSHLSDLKDCNNNTVINETSINGPGTGNIPKNKEDQKIVKNQSIPNISEGENAQGKVNDNTIINEINMSNSDIPKNVNDTNVKSNEPVKNITESTNKINNNFTINNNPDANTMKDLIERSTLARLDLLKEKDSRCRNITNVNIDNSNSGLSIESLLDLSNLGKKNKEHRSTESVPARVKLGNLKKDVEILKKDCKEIKTHLQEDNKDLKDLLKLNLYKPSENKITVTQMNNSENQKNSTNKEDTEEIKKDNKKDKNVKDENIKDENIKDENVKDENVKDENVKDENVKDESKEKVPFFKEVVTEKKTKREIEEVTIIEEPEKSVRFNENVSVKEDEIPKIPFDDNTKVSDCTECKEKMKLKKSFFCPRCICYRLYEKKVTKGNFLKEGERSFYSVEKEKTKDGFRKKKTKIVSGSNSGSSSTMSSSDDSLAWDISGSEELLSLGSSSSLGKYDGFSRSQSSLGSQLLPTIPDEETISERSSSELVENESEEYIEDEYIEEEDEVSTEESNLKDHLNQKDHFNHKEDSKEVAKEEFKENSKNDSSSHSEVKIKHPSKEKLNAFYKTTYRSKDSDTSSKYSFSDEESKKEVNVYETPKLLEKFNSLEPIYAEIEKKRSVKDL